MESFAWKNDSTISPCLFVGTSVGMVLIISLNIPSADEQRFTEQVVVLSSGTFLSLKGAVLTFSCMDGTGGLMQPPYEVWRDPNTIDENEKICRRKLVMNSSSSQEIGDHQYTIICSGKQAKVFSLPSQTCLYVHNITETSFILQADVVVMCNSPCLACFCANGHIMIMSLPSLRLMLDVNYLPLTDMRIAWTFCFTSEGQALYLVSPTEIQRLTYSQEMYDNLQDMLGDLFTPIETPEAQNRGFLRGLFGGSGQTFDREELCHGECHCGECKCHAGYIGDNCNCSTDISTCRAKDGQICSDRGNCICGQCQCTEPGAFGETCEKCPTCPDACSTKRDCVECLLLHSGKPDNQTCQHLCKDEVITWVDAIVKDDQEAVLCFYKTAKDCVMMFSYTDLPSGKSNLTVLREPECGTAPNAMTILLAVVGSILLIGIALLAIWKLLVTIHDRREFAKFRSERSRARYEMASNPLYRKPISTHTVDFTFNKFNKSYNGTVD